MLPQKVLRDVRGGCGRRRGYRSECRTGLSLLEVLISVFVLMVGLLGLVSVLPLANRAVEQTAQADRAHACGSYGLREVRTREVLTPAGFQPLGSPVAWVDRMLTSVVNPFTGQFNAAYSYCVDPWLLTQKAPQVVNDPNADCIDSFPFEPAGYNSANPDPTWYVPQLTMRRVTVGLFPPMANPPNPAEEYTRQRTMWMRLFTWGDDLVFGDAEEDAVRPRPLFSWADSSQPQVAAFPPPAGHVAPSDRILRGEVHGNFTWLFTVTPEVARDPTWEWSVQMPRRLAYSVSVVVFHKREPITPDEYDGVPSAESPPPDTPPERTVMGTLLGDGWGGGDLLLRVPSVRAGYLERIRRNEWLMLCGQDPLWGRAVFRWYRIISAGDIEVLPDGTVQRFVSVAGPDWNSDPSTGWCYRDPITGAYADINGDGAARDVQVALFTGVVGVYTTTMELP